LEGLGNFRRLFSWRVADHQKELSNGNGKNPREDESPSSFALTREIVDSDSNLQVLTELNLQCP
jgi:hypothetical protein